VVDFGDEHIVDEPLIEEPTSTEMSACVELSRMLGSVRCIQTPLLAVQMSGSRKCDSAECRSRTISQKAVWTVRSVSHSTSKSN
jgi:hypothetical protein